MDRFQYLHQHPHLTTTRVRSRPLVLGRGGGAFELLQLRPGVVLSYQRNEVTLHEMQKMGFRILSGVSFLTGEERIADGDRAAISFEGSELVRGGGGPRCMTCPVLREDPWD